MSYLPWGCVISNISLSNTSKQVSLGLHQVQGCPSFTMSGDSLVSCDAVTVHCRWWQHDLLCKRGFLHCDRSSSQSTDAQRRLQNGPALWDVWECAAHNSLAATLVVILPRGVKLPRLLVNRGGKAAFCQMHFYVPDTGWCNIKVITSPQYVVIKWL